MWIAEINGSAFENEELKELTNDIACYYNDDPFASTRDDKFIPFIDSLCFSNRNKLLEVVHSQVVWFHKECEELLDSLIKQDACHTKMEA